MSFVSLRNILVACALFLPSVAWSQQAVLSTLDGFEHRGRLVEIGPRDAVIRDAAGEQSLAVSKLHWLRLESTGYEAPSAKGFVELTGGGRIPAAGITTSEVELELLLPLPLTTSDGQRLSLPYAQAAAYVFDRGDKSLRKQWDRIRQTDATADLVVIKRRDGQTLDYVEGIVTAVTESSVRVELDGEPVEVKRARVYGVVCFRPDTHVGDTAQAVRVRVPGGDFLATGVTWKPGSVVAIEVDGLAVFRAPLEQVVSIDYSRGGVVLLGDLEPLEVAWRPFFNPPRGEELVREWGRLRVDQAYSGGPLTLRDENGELQSFAKGLAIRSHGEVTYETPRGLAYFRATGGLDPESSAASSVDLRILADGQERFARRFVAGEPPQEIELPIANASRFRLVVDYAQGADAGDNLHLANARFTK